MCMYNEKYIEIKIDIYVIIRIIFIFEIWQYNFVGFFLSWYLWILKMNYYEFVLFYREIKLYVKQ